MPSPHFGHTRFGKGKIGPCPAGYQPRILRDSAICIRFTRGQEKSGEVWQKDEKNLVLRGFFTMREHLAENKWLGSTPGGMEFKGETMHDVVMQVIGAPLV